MISDVEQLVRRARDQVERAAAARAAADRDRGHDRRENDRWVTGGVHWNGYSLESLQRMVGERANPGQLDMLATEWERHGERIADGARDLSRSLTRLMRFWSGSAAQDAHRVVATNAAWVAEIGATARQMSAPIQDASGALRSAQDTMPGSPRSAWYATVGGGAAAGFAVGGPVGAVFGAALGGIASAFGFGSNRKKLKRKAVQTMQRYEAALLGVDGATPRFGTPSDGVRPGTDPVGTRPPGTGVPGPGVVVPGGPGAVLEPGRIPPPMPGGTSGMGTTPAYAPGFGSGWEARWQGLTGFGGGAAAGAGSPGPGSGAGGAFGVGGVPGAGGLGMGRGAGAGGLGAGRGAGVGAGSPGRGAIGAGTRGAGSRFGRGAVAADAHGRGAGGYGTGAGAGARRGEDDGEHRRRVPIEEDPFTPDDLRAAPPVIGI